MNRVTAALGASESHTWKIASPGGRSKRCARFPFGQPRSGVRGKAYHNHRFTSSSFLEKSLRIFDQYLLSAEFPCELQAKNNFSPPTFPCPPHHQTFYISTGWTFCVSYYQRVTYSGHIKWAYVALKSITFVFPGCLSVRCLSGVSFHPRWGVDKHPPSH